MSRALPFAASKPMVGEAAHRLVGPFMDAHISVAGRISAANVEFCIRMIFFVDTIRRAQNNRAAAVRAAHCAHTRDSYKGVVHLILLQYSHQPFCRQHPPEDG